MHVIILCITFWEADKHHLQSIRFDSRSSTTLVPHFFSFGHITRHMRILVSQLEIKLVPPAVEAWSLNLWTAREVPVPHFYFNCFSGFEMISHCGFRFHFPNGWWCWTSFQGLIGYFYNFSGEMSIQILFPHVIGLSFYCLVERDFPLCILDISLLSDICVCVSHSVMSDSLRPYALKPARLLCPWNSPGKNTGVTCHSLLQGIFPSQGSNPGLLHCRHMLYQLSHQGSPIWYIICKYLLPFCG